ncbi:MAG: T9SS type A sorting domain-containing protein [Candidatus Kapabacteria bacterium]|nr:T9SS type A sorting domain-containing protein [Candidatus Kapabacteria bacterium]
MRIFILFFILIFVQLRLSAQEDFPEWEKLDYSGYYGPYQSKIAVNDRNELFVSLPTGVFKSTNQGDNWARLNMPDSLIYVERSMLLMNNTIAILGRSYEYNQWYGDAGVAQYIVISKDYGKHWETYPFIIGISDPYYFQNINCIDKFGNIWGSSQEYSKINQKYQYKYSIFRYDYINDTFHAKLELLDNFSLVNYIIEDSTIFAFFQKKEGFDDPFLCIFRSTNLGQSWDTLYSNSEGSIFFEIGKNSLQPYATSYIYSQKKLYITLDRGNMVIDIDNKSYELTEMVNNMLQPYRLFKRDESEFYAFTSFNENNRPNLRRSRDTMKTWEDIDYNLQYTRCNDLAIDSTNNVYRLDNLVFRLKDGETNWTASWSGLLNASGGYFQVNSKSEILRGNLYYKDGEWINLENIWTECRVQLPQSQMRILPNDRIALRFSSCGLVHTQFPFDKYEEFIAHDSILIFTIYNWIEKNQHRYLASGLVELDNNQRNFYILESKDNCETWEILENAYLPHNGSYSDGCFRFNKYDEFLYIGDSAKVHLSTDKGKSWKLVHDESLNPYFSNRENSSYINTTYNSTTGVGFALYQGYGLMLLTRDHGRTWTTYTNQAPLEPIYEFIYSAFRYSTSTRYREIITDLSTGYFYAPTWGGIYRSTDSLRSFHNMSKGLLEPSVITELQLGNDGKLYAMNYMGLWRTKDKVVSSVENTDEPILSRGNGLFIYPNPASEYIEIIINPTVNRGVDEASGIKIFNTLGECVINEQIHPMTPSHRMNIEHLQTGLYFVRIGNKVEKFVKW